MILTGHYQRSRSFGFPLHESASALFYAAGGLRLVNLATLAVAVLGLLAARKIAMRLAPDRATLALAALGFSPLVLVNAASAIDFDWDFAAGMALLLAALSLQRHGPRLQDLALYGTATVALILLRPDNGLFAAAVTGALIAPRSKLRGPVAGIAIAAAAAAAAVYLVLNGVAMFAGAVSTTRPWPARLARAAVLLSAVIGPGGALALVLLARLRTRQWQGPRALLRQATALAWLFYVPRFAALPDQADYLILPMTLTVLLAAITLPWPAARACAVLFVAPSLITLSLLQRDARTGALQLHIAPQWGALPQDWEARDFANRMAAPAMAAAIAQQLPGAGAPAILRAATYMPGYVSPAGDLVIGQADLYHVLPVGQGAASLATVPRAWFGRLWACADPLGPAIGWRGWEAPAPTTALRRWPEPCRLVDKPG